jgi:hypothetical protein
MASILDMNRLADPGSAVTMSGKYRTGSGLSEK